MWCHPAVQGWGHRRASPAAPGSPLPTPPQKPLEPCSTLVLRPSAQGFVHVGSPCTTQAPVHVHTHTLLAPPQAPGTMSSLTSPPQGTFMCTQSPPQVTHTTMSRAPASPCPLMCPHSFRGPPMRPQHLLMGLTVDRQHGAILGLLRDPIHVFPRQPGDLQKGNLGL